MHCIAKAIVLVVGFVFSCFFARKAVEILVDTKTAADRKWAWWFWQGWLNFVGSATGWAAAFYFIFYRLLPLAEFKFKIEDTVIILIALLGVTGLLPYALSKASLK
jgi:hypothetical protein